jgi:DNA-binding MarR family transcriptional regulator
VNGAGAAAVCDNTHTTKGSHHMTRQMIEAPADERATASATIDIVETQLARLVRALEAVRLRRPDAPSQALDRAVYLLLRTLDVSGSSPVNALAEALDLDPSTAARQVTAMKRKGLVSTQRDPRDGRAVLVTPTSEGLYQMRRMQHARRARIAEILREWPADEKVVLARMLTRLNDSIVR